MSDPRRYSESILGLARVMYETMERLDPGCCGGDSWDSLSDDIKEFYALTAEEIVNNATLVIRAMSDYDVILRHPKLPKKMD